MGSEASECAHDDAEGDRGGTGGDRSGADMFAGLAVTGVEPVGVEVYTGCDIEVRDAHRFASSDASEGVMGSEASECAHGDAEGDRGNTGGDRGGADLFAGLAVTRVEPVGAEVCTGCDIEVRDARRRAAGVIQRRWRGGRPRSMGLTSIERGWVGARARQLGALSAHVTFLQYFFRRSRELRPGSCWRRGGMAGVMSL